MKKCFLAKKNVVDTNDKEECLPICQGSYGASKNRGDTGLDDRYKVGTEKNKVEGETCKGCHLSIPHCLCASD